eukprot:bmy_15128T0
MYQGPYRTSAGDVPKSGIVNAMCAGHSGAPSLNTQFAHPSEYRTPNCNQYKLPGCPRDFNPVCGSDMSTYPNECTLCMKIREDGHDIKIIRSGPC